MKIICLMRRKPSLSHQQFKDYYEEHHAKLAVELLPFFSEYRRNYLIKDEAYQPDHLDEVPAAPDHDVVTEISFASRQDYQRMVDALADPDIGQRIAKDEDKFLDRSAMIMFFVDEHVTPPGTLAYSRS